MDTTRDMVMMKGGNMILMIDGEMLRMDDDMVTPDGTLVRTDGTLILPDGTISMLLEDEALIVDQELTRLAGI